ncbi:MAG: DUF364 domain-containing protein [Candidatus Rifleibacteriota bacterium]
MSLILDAVKSTIPRDYYSLPVEKLSTFSYVTTVKTKRLGICMTLSDDRIFPYRMNLPISNLGSIEKLGLGKIISWTDSLHGIERSFAIAAINSALPLKGNRFFSGNALEVADRLGAGKKVAVVGHFPHLDRIKNVASEFYIIEKRPQEGDLPAEAAVDIIPKMDLVAITGVTCLNDTIEGLLALKKKNAVFIVLGPSVPLSPVLFDFGVDIIGGAWVEDEETVYKFAMQGGAPRTLVGLKNVLLPAAPEILEDYEEIRAPD